MTSTTAPSHKPAQTQSALQAFNHWKANPLKAALQVLIMSLIIVGSFVEKGVGAPALLMVLVCIIALGVNWRPLFQPNTLQSKQRLVLLCLAAPGVASIAAFLLADLEYWTSSRLDLPSRYLLILPVFLILSRYRFNPMWMFSTLTLGCLSAGVTAIYLGLFKGNFYVSGGLGHHILFGNFAAILSAALLALSYFLHRRSRWIPIIGAIGFLGGATAVLLSGARGAWLTLFTLIILLPLFFAHRWAWLKSLLILCLCVGFVHQLYHSPSLKVKHRIDSAVLDLKNYKTPHGARSSVGARLEMWQTASIIFSNHILFGAGPRTFQEEGKALVAAGAVRDYGGHFHHAHNQVLNTLASTGLFGFLALIALHVGPIICAWPYLKNRSEPAATESKATDATALEAINQTRCFAAIAIICSIGYIIAGLTEAILDRHAATMFYLVLTSLCLSQLTQQPAEQPATKLTRSTTEPGNKSPTKDSSWNMAWFTAPITAIVLFTLSLFFREH